MKNSSNKDMGQVFEHLANIKMAEPNINLYIKTVSKIQTQNLIPMFWVRAAACLLVAFITTEIYLTYSGTHSNSKDVSILINNPKNILYNE